VVRTFVLKVASAAQAGRRSWNAMRAFFTETLD
jgi:hypothetical protein